MKIIGVCIIYDSIQMVMSTWRDCDKDAYRILFLTLEYPNVKRSDNSNRYQITWILKLCSMEIIITSFILLYFSEKKKQFNSIVFD